MLSLFAFNVHFNFFDFLFSIFISINLRTTSIVNYLTWTVEHNTESVVYPFANVIGIWHSTNFFNAYFTIMNSEKLSFLWISGNKHYRAHDLVFTLRFQTEICWELRTTFCRGWWRNIIRCIHWQADKRASGMFLSSWGMYLMKNMEVIKFYTIYYIKHFIPCHLMITEFDFDYHFLPSLSPFLCYSLFYSSLFNICCITVYAKKLVRVNPASAQNRWQVIRDKFEYCPTWNAF